jgi:hypothetical protein
MGTAWSRHGKGMLCVNPPLRLPHRLYKPSLQLRRFGTLTGRPVYCLPCSLGCSNRFLRLLCLFIELAKFCADSDRPDTQH